jgi:hypothetical protein
VKHTLVLLLVVALLAAMTLPAHASPDAPRLKLSHFECIDTVSAELHFVLLEAPPGADGSSVNWAGRLNGNIIAGIAPYTKTKGPTAHYAAVVALPTGSNTFAIDIASLAIAGETFHLKNPQAYTVECTPLGIVFGSFTAAVDEQVVTLLWDTFTEYSNVGFNVYRDVSPASGVDEETWTYLGFVPSLSPGGSSGAEYQYTDTQGPGTWYYWVEDVDL